MKYFLDTEFIEHAGGIDLVSIGIVCEDGRKFYAESSEFDARAADPWVKTNVLSRLVFWGKWPKNEQTPPIIFVTNRTRSIYGSLEEIRIELLSFFGYTSPYGDLKISTEPPTPPVQPSANIEIFAYFADYDWVVFCRIFGRMIDLPKGMPMWCIDLKQMMWERDLSSDWKREVCPDPIGEHNALVDAEWNQSLYKAIVKHMNP